MQVQVQIFQIFSILFFVLIILTLASYFDFFFSDNVQLLHSKGFCRISQFSDVTFMYTYSFCNLKTTKWNKINTKTLRNELTTLILEGILTIYKFLTKTKIEKIWKFALARTLQNENFNKNSKLQHACICQQAQLQNIKNKIKKKLIKKQKNSLIFCFYFFWINIFVTYSCQETLL